ncbi:hypothetical protein QWJ41_21765, partial [Nocardioides sp. SOB44]
PTEPPAQRRPVDWRRMRSPWAVLALLGSLLGAIGTAAGAAGAGRRAEDASVALVWLLALCVVGAAVLDSLG